MWPSTLLLCFWQMPQCPSQETNHPTPPPHGEPCGSLNQQPPESGAWPSHWLCCFLNQLAKKKIHEHTTPDRWCHIPEILNLEGCLSKPFTLDAVSGLSTQILMVTGGHWPNSKVGDIMENIKEVISLRANQSTTAAAGASLDELLRRFYLWPKLVKTFFNLWGPNAVYQPYLPMAGSDEHRCSPLQGPS